MKRIFSNTSWMIFIRLSLALNTYMLYLTVNFETMKVIQIIRIVEASPEKKETPI